MIALTLVKTDRLAAPAQADDPVTIGFVLSIPVVYAGIVSFVLLDAFVTLFVAVCFPIWGIPTLRRSDYLKFDRAKLPYLNWYQRLNCRYCSYANGLAAYLRETAARTEQYWCPVKHAAPPPAPHTRYHLFLDFGDAEGYRARAETTRTRFEDLTAAPEARAAWRVR